MCILVSINCITYNHEDYITDAIESFLMQKTDFDFEILIGEDCSTDNTKKIVKQYVSKYPNKIKLISSEKNVGARKNTFRLYENAKGKYIALCEGDDYWIDPYKLQKQVNYMKDNPGCTICFHGAKIFRGKISIQKYIRPFKSDKILTAGDIVLGKGSGFTPTASIMYIKEAFSNPPKWYTDTSFGDYPLALYLTSNGYAYYIDQIMSVYRTGVKNSASSKLDNDNARINHKKEIIKILNGFNDYSNNRFSNEVNKVKLKMEFDILILQNKMCEIKQSLRYMQYLKDLKMKEKVKLYTQYYFPEIYNKLSYIKNQISINCIMHKNH